MIRRMIAAAGALCIILSIPTPVAALAEGGRPITPTSLWTAPDLSAASPQTPELLVLRVAQEEVGYREGPLSDQSKYGEWFGKRQTAWCAEFITWCVDQADKRYGTRMLNHLFPYNGGPKTGAPFYIDKGRFISDTGKLITHEKQWYTESKEYVANNSYIPHPGDLVWFCYYVRGETDHIAIVEGVSIEDDGRVQIHVIEGNNPDSVQRNRYALDDKSIYGYGTPVQRVMTNMRLYNRGLNVKKLNDMLIETGFLNQDNAPEDEYTQVVQDAVLMFQRKSLLMMSGIADRDTWLALEAAIEAPEQ